MNRLHREQKVVEAKPDLEEREYLLFMLHMNLIRWLHVSGVCKFKTWTMCSMQTCRADDVSVSLISQLYQACVIIINDSELYDDFAMQWAKTPPEVKPEFLCVLVAAAEIIKLKTWDKLKYPSLF